MKRTLGVACAAGVWLSTCGNGQAVTMTPEPPSCDSTAVAAEELPLPQIPDFLRTPTDRAAYLLQHFWDGLSFADTLRSRNRAFMEQNFANFVNLFPHADSAALPPSVARLLERAAADAPAFDLLMQIAEKYLYDPNSPMLDEAYYALFLEAFLRSPLPAADARLRPERQLQTVRKNRPGTPAADFAYSDRSGRRRTLRQTALGCELLLVFYDPDCEHCAEILAGLKDDGLLRRRVREGRLSVLAVYADGDRQAWERTLRDLPAEWEAGFDLTGVQEHGLYVLRAMPTLYWLDGDRRVAVKDMPVEALFERLRRME